MGANHLPLHKFSLSVPKIQNGESFSYADAYHLHNGH